MGSDNTKNHDISKKRLTPVRVAVLYLFLGGAFFISSNRILHALTSKINIFNLLQIINGLIFIIMTSIILYVIIKHRVASVQHVNEELKKSEESIRSLFENTTIGVYRTTPDGRILMANPALIKMLGYSSFEDLSERNLEQKEYQPFYPRKLFREKLETDGEIKGLESYWMKKDGTNIYLRESAVVIRGNDQNILYYEGTVEDISERKLAETALQESELRYRTLAEAAHDSIFIINPDYTIQYVNIFGASLLGCNPDSMIGKPLNQFFPAEAAARMTSKLQEVFDTGSPTYDLNRTPFLEHEIWLDTWLAPIKNEKGEITAVLGISRDATKNKQAEEELRRTKTYMESILNNSLDLIFTIKQDGKPGFINPQLRNMTGYTAEQAQKMHFLEYIPQHRKAFMLEKWKEVNRGIPSIYETEIMKADGSLIHCLISQTIIKEFDEILVAVLEITEKKKAEIQLAQTASELQAIFQALPDIYFKINTAGIILEWKESKQDDLFIPPDQFLHKNFRELLPPEVAQKFEDAIEEIMLTKSLVMIEYPLFMPRGQEHYEARLVPLMGDQIIVIIRNITERKLTEEALRKANLIIENSPVILFIWKAEEGWPVEFVSNNISQYGYTAEEFYAGYRKFTDIIYPDDLERINREVIQYSNEGRKDFRQIYRIICKNQDIRWVDDWTLIIRDEKGIVTHFQVIIRDITERKWAEERLNYLAYHDALTGLPNRLLFNDRLSQAIGHAHTRRELVALMLLDLDHFKEVNDTLGHDIGDMLLQAVAQRLKISLREGDTVARMSGDEFTFIITDIINIQDVEKNAHSIIESFMQPFTIDFHELAVTPSIGISIYPFDGDSHEALMKNADIAMYRAKGQGRNNYQFFEPAMNISSSERIQLEKSLRKALERKEFIIYYQPYIDLITEKILGVEALLRWQHMHLGLLLPMKFIPLAEETGIIITIDEWVLSNACKQNKSWQDAGLPPISIAINLSAREFHQQDLLEVVSRVLRETQLDPQLLELEITESTAMQNLENTVFILSKLKDIGAKITIDDFGTGYSSLSYLKKFPIHSLKINQYFIQDIDNNPDDAAIVSAIIALAHSLNIKVIAEAVETEEQKQLLLSLNCDEMQGYLFSRPILPDELIPLLKNYHK